MNRAERRYLSSKKKRKSRYRTPQEIIDDEMAKLEIYYRLLEEREKKSESKFNKRTKDEK
jgi:hypothetical protein